MTGPQPEADMALGAPRSEPLGASGPLHSLKTDALKVRFTEAATDAHPECCRYDQSCLDHISNTAEPNDARR